MSTTAEAIAPSHQRDNLVRALAEPPVLERAADGKSLGDLTGHFTRFGVWYEIDSPIEGHFLERMMPGSTQKTIDENGANMRVTFNHGTDPSLGDKVLGPIAELREDEIGAFYRVPLFDTAYNRELEPGLRAGVYGSSMRFAIVKDRWNDAPNPSDYNPTALPERTVTEIRAQEFGPVTFPANEGADAGLRHIMRSLTDRYAAQRIGADPDAERKLGVGVTQRGQSEHNESTRSTEPPAGTRETSRQQGDTERKDRGTMSDTETRERDERTDEGSRPAPTMDELRAREIEITQAEDKLRTDNVGRVLTQAQRAELDAHETELEVVRQAIADGERLEQIARRNAEREERRERESDVVQPIIDRNRAFGQVRYGKMTERELYDLSTVRGSFAEPEVAMGELRSRAKESLERAEFPDWMGAESDVKDHVERLLGDDGVDPEDPTKTPGDLAMRILRTGSKVYGRALYKHMVGQMLSYEEQTALERGQQVARALGLGSGAAGAFAIVYTLDPTLIPVSNIGANPFRAVCRVINLVGTNEWRQSTIGAATAQYRAEGTEMTDNSPTLAQTPIIAQRADSFVPISIEATQDWESYLSDVGTAIRDGKDDLEATKFLLGTGTNEPFGLQVGATNNVTAAGVASFAVADLYSLEAAVPGRFRKRAVLFGNRAQANRIRQFDTAGGANLWKYLNELLVSNMGSAEAAAFGTTLGYYFYESTAMPSALTTGNKILIAGAPDMYAIVDRVGMNIEVIPHLFGATNRYPTGQRGVVAFWRNGAKVIDASAFRTLVTG